MLNDFGFTAVDESEIDAPADELDSVNTKLTKLYEAVQPLLENLKANPEKEYIHWPDRVKRVEQFQKTLKSIYDGN
jgi:hypothetical protein